MQAPQEATSPLTSGCPVHYSASLPTFQDRISGLNHLPGPTPPFSILVYTAPHLPTFCPGYLFPLSALVHLPYQAWALVQGLQLGFSNLDNCKTPLSPLPQVTFTRNLVYLGFLLSTPGFSVFLSASVVGGGGHIISSSKSEPSLHIDASQTL